jgi:hypothetical protein
VSVLVLHVPFTSQLGAAAALVTAGALLARSGMRPSAAERELNPR